MNRIITLTLFLATCSTAAGQSPYVSVSGQKQVSPEGVAWMEVAANGSTADHRVLVVAAHGQRPRATTNALAASPVWVDGPQVFPADPFVVPDHESSTTPGRLYVGGMAESPTFGVILTYYDIGTVGWHLNSVYAVNGDNVDKPWLAVGPSIVNPGTLNYYLPVSRHVAACYTEKLWLYANTIPLSTAWPNASMVSANQDPAPCTPISTTCKYRGWGVRPVVTDEGDIVTVARDANVANGGPGCYNERRPYVIWSRDDGATWLPDSESPILLGDGLVVAASTKTPADQLADTPWYVDRRCGAPSIAIDRATNSVFVAFAARSDSPPIGGDGPDWNTDIWIFRGTKDLQTGDWVFGNDPSDQVLHLTDAMLGLELNGDGKGPDQFVPAIAIDCAGAINLMFYDNRAEAQSPTSTDDTNAVGRPVDVYYARIRNWPNGVPEVYTKRLTPASFPVKYTEDMLGDYHTLAAGGSEGKWFYPVYIAKKPGTGGDPAGWSVRTCFMNSVFIRECLSDLNLNRAADTGDVVLFWDAFSQADPMADVTDDGCVNSEDVDEFIDVYSDAIGN